MCLDGSERRLSGWTAWSWTPVFVPGGRWASGAHRGDVWAASLDYMWGRARWVWGTPCPVPCRPWFRGLRGGEPDQEGWGASPRAAPPSVCLKAVPASATDMGSDPHLEALLNSQCISTPANLQMPAWAEPEPHGLVPVVLRVTAWGL